MKRLFLILALLLAPLFAFAQDAEWQTVISRDLRFRLEMPAPAEQTVTREGDKGLVSPRTAWESKLDGQMFDFDFVDYEDGWFSAHDSKKMARDLGRGEAEKAFPVDKYKYVLDAPVTLQGWDGYALDIDAPDGQSVMMRTYIVGDRLYRMLVTHKGDAKTKDAAIKFLESLKFTDTK
jgi:hypothetical protein